MWRHPGWHHLEVHQLRVLHGGVGLYGPILRYVGGHMENLGTSKVQSFFVWLILRDRVWTADRLQRRGWPNCGDCQLFMLKPESMVHLLFKCRYSLRIWNYIISWLGLDSADISLWEIWHGWRMVTLLHLPHLLPAKIRCLSHRANLLGALERVLCESLL
jgi:hypothetical protein